MIFHVTDKDVMTQKSHLKVFFLWYASLPVMFADNIFIVIISFSSYLFALSTQILLSNSCFLA